MTTYDLTNVGDPHGLRSCRAMLDTYRVATEVELAAQSVDRACTFIPRARRVEVHSLASDKDQLLRWARGSIDVRARSDGAAFIRRQLPPEELLESLAVRVRPFILQKYPVHHAKVMTGIGWLVKSAHESLRRDVAELRRS